MAKSDEPMSKPKMAYISFYAMPEVTDALFKLKKFAFAFDFLFLLQDTFNVNVFDFIGINYSFSKKGIQFTYFKRNKSTFFIPWRLLKRIRKLNPDMVYIQGLAYSHQIILLKKFVNSSCKIIVQDHANQLPKGIKRTLFKIADKSVNHYLFTSKEMATPYLKQGLISSSKKITQCVEGSTHFKCQPTIKKEPLSFLWVGRLDKNKDPLTILKAFKKFVPLHPLATLTMIFENKSLLKAVTSFIAEHQLEKQIKLIGKLRHNEMEYWYQKSRFFILGSHKEGGPISLIEAMACGCIPVVTKIPAFKTMTNNGKCGFLFEPGNEKSLFKVLQELPTVNYDELTQKVLNQFQNELSHQAIANKLITLFET